MLQFVSSNPNKVRELEGILQISIQMNPLELIEIQTDDLTELVIYKARNAFQLSPSPLLVEDTSLYFEQWRNLPGPFIKWFIKSFTLEKLVELLSQGENLKARAVCVLASPLMVKKYIALREKFLVKLLPQEVIMDSDGIQFFSRMEVEKLLGR